MGQKLTKAPRSYYDAIIYTEGTQVIAEDNNGRKIDSGVAGVDDISVLHSARDYLPAVGGTISLGSNLTITETMVLNKPVQVVGRGKYATTLTDDRTDGTDAIQITSHACTLRGFRLRGNKNQRHGILIDDVYNSGTVLDNIYVGYRYAGTGNYGFGDTGNSGAGICVNTSRLVTIRDCVVGDNWNGITFLNEWSPVQEANVNMLLQTHTTFNRNHGVYIPDGVGISIFSGDYEGNAGYGIYSQIHSTAYPQTNVTGGYFEANTLGNCYVSSGSGFKFSPARRSVVGSAYDLDLVGVVGAEIDGTVRINVDSNCADIIVRPVSSIQLTGDLSKIRLVHPQKSNYLPNVTSLYGMWTVANATGSLETSPVPPFGTQSRKLMNDGASGQHYIRYALPHLYLRGKTITLGAWVYCPTTNSNTQSIRILGSASYTNVNITKADKWQWIQAVYASNLSETYLYAYFYSGYDSSTDADDVLYICDAKVSTGGLVYPTTGDEVYGGDAGNVSILPGEVRNASGSLTAGNANAIAFAWHDPEAQDILVRKVTIRITTAGGTAGGLLDVGIADDATGTNLGTEFFNDIDLNAAAILKSTIATPGTQTVEVLCQDSASATDGWIVGKILVENAASLVGKYYIEYEGA